MSETAEYTTPDRSHLVVVKWIKLKAWCELAGSTPDAVHALRRKGEWVEGRQCKVGPDGNLWVNVVEVNKWIEK